MKLITLNTHSITEPNYYEKMLILAKAIATELPDVVALQEVNQTIDMPLIEGKTLVTSNADIRTDNYAEALLNELKKLGVSYNCVWLPIKIGYGKYDEGLAILSRSPIIDTDNVLISKCNDYSYWKTRRIIGIKNELGWFYSVHMGWWNDEEEPFIDQWKCIQETLKDPKYREGTIWLMGDFNSQDDVRGEGYDLVLKSGWKDTYLLAEEKDDGITVAEEIDGWREADGRSKAAKNEKRLDYIFCNTQEEVRASNVICNGKNAPVVSDHYGVMITV